MFAFSPAMVIWGLNGLMLFAILPHSVLPHPIYWMDRRLLVHPPHRFISTTLDDLGE